MKTPILSTSRKLPNRLFASSIRGNNLQIRRSNFQGVVNSYFTITEVSLVLVHASKQRSPPAERRSETPDLSVEISACVQDMKTWLLKKLIQSNTVLVIILRASVRFRLISWVACLGKSI